MEKIPTEELDRLLAAMIQSAEGISDLLFVSGKPPQVEVHGKLKPFALEPPESALTNQRIEGLAGAIINGNARLIQDLAETGSCDCSYSLPNFCRFRVNIYHQNGSHAMVLRRLQSQVPSLEKLHLPPVFQEIIKEKNGLVFLTGATGSGKTTTLAAMLNEINQTSEVHIVTLEDPIEFLHPHLKATFSQRELGRDFYTFPDGMRAALRQAPKVILVGEMRDRETVKIALSAAETGHLVLSTLHTINAGETINRILGMFEPDEQEQIRIRLADSLRWVISQRLVPKIGGGRHALVEMMGSNLRTQESIRLGESEGKTFYEIIEASFPFGWRTFDTACLEAFENGLVTEETAMLYCTKRSVAARGIDLIKKGRGEMAYANTLRMKAVPPAPTSNEPPPVLKLK